MWETFSGKFSTNLKLHLKSSHREAYDEVIKKEKQNKEKENEKKSCTRANAACNFSMESNQPQITTFLKRPKLYNNEDPKCKAITKKLSIFLAASSAPISLVEDPTFSSLITELGSRYSIPSRYMMSKKIDEVLIDLKGNILSHMLQARKLNFCNFFASHKRHSVTLAVKRMPSPHTGEEVLKIVLQIFKDWNIPDHKIGSIITDNGSNMVKAFKIIQLQQKENMQNEGDKYVNPSAAGFDVYYLIATFLDPKYTLILNDQQTTVVKAHLIVALKTEISEFTDTTLESGNTETVSVVANSDEQPPLKKFRHLSSIISQRLREAHQVDKGIAATTAENEIERFYELRFNIPTPSKKRCSYILVRVGNYITKSFSLSSRLNGSTCI